MPFYQSSSPQSSEVIVDSYSRLQAKGGSPLQPPPPPGSIELQQRDWLRWQQQMGGPGATSFQYHEQQQQQTDNLSWVEQQSLSWQLQESERLKRMTMESLQPFPGNVAPAGGLPYLREQREQHLEQYIREADQSHLLPMEQRDRLVPHQYTGSTMPQRSWVEEQSLLWQAQGVYGDQGALGIPPGTQAPYVVQHQPSRWNQQQGVYSPQGDYLPQATQQSPALYHHQQQSPVGGYPRQSPTTAGGYPHPQQWNPAENSAVDRSPQGSYYHFAMPLGTLEQQQQQLQQRHQPQQQQQQQHQQQQQPLPRSRAVDETVGGVWGRVPLNLRPLFPPAVAQPASGEEWHASDDDPPEFTHEDCLEEVVSTGRVMGIGGWDHEDSLGKHQGMQH